MYSCLSIFRDTLFLSTVLSFISFCLFFFFNDTATTEIYTLSLHDALPISGGQLGILRRFHANACDQRVLLAREIRQRSEEHTSELQSRPHLVCRLLLEKKKKKRDDAMRNHEILKTMQNDRSLT